jgi:hypothetical protein
MFNGTFGKFHRVRCLDDADGLDCGSGGLDDRQLNFLYLPLFLLSFLRIADPIRPSLAAHAMNTMLPWLVTGTKQGVIFIHR